MSRHFSFHAKRATCSFQNKPLDIYATVKLRVGASFNQRLASVVAGVLDEVLLEAGRQILRLVLPFGSVGIGVAGVENLGVHARQFGRNLKVEVRNLLGGRLQDVAGQNRVDDAAGILDGSVMPRSVPASFAVKPDRK